MFFLGLVLVIIAALIGVLRGNSIPALAQRAAAAGWDLGPSALFVARHRKVLSIGVLVLGFVVLIAWSNSTPLVLLLISLVVVVLVGAILFVSSQSALVAGNRFQRARTPPARTVMGEDGAEETPMVTAPGDCECPAPGSVPVPDEAGAGCLGGCHACWSWLWGPPLGRWPSSRRWAD